MASVAVVVLSCEVAATPGWVLGLCCWAMGLCFSELGADGGLLISEKNKK